MNIQQGDVVIFQTTDNGNIELDSDGLFVMDPGLGSMAYLCLFGGNEDDAGLGDETLQWWGNFDEPEPSRRYRSRTQHLLASIPATSNNLLRLQAAAEQDCQPLLDEGIAESLSVAVGIPSLNCVKFEINFGANSGTVVFYETWVASI